MKIHLCGSRNYNGRKEVYWSSIREFIIAKSITQLLFLGTAAETHPGPFALQYFRDNAQLPKNIQVLDAEIETNIILVNNPTVYVLGGMKQLELINFVTTHPKLENLIRTCPYYFGESMGAKLIGSKLRVGAPGTPLVAGLGILENTIIEGHYSQKQRREVLRDEVKSGNLKFGLGIDEDAEVLTTPELFPKFQKLGPGIVELIT
jgi:hypothetical protein